MSPANINCLTGCCSTCTICSDDFGRTDGSDITSGSDCGWTVDSGTWDLNSGKLRCTAAGIVVNDTTHPDSDITMAVEVDFVESTNGASVDVIVGYVDNTHFYYARYLPVTAGFTNIQLRKKNGGSDTLLNTSAAVIISTGVSYTASVCTHESGAITAYLNGTVIVTAPVQTITGLGVAFRSSSGTTTFDDFTFSKIRHSTDATQCPSCGIFCDNGTCVTGTAPRGWQAVIPSGNYAGTYITDNWSPPGGGSGNCRWTGTASGSCSIDQSTVTVVFNGAVSFNLSSSGGNTVIWRTTDGITIGRDCTSTWDCSPISNSVGCAAIGTAHATVSPLT